MTEQQNPFRSAEDEFQDAQDSELDQLDEVQEDDAQPSEAPGPADQPTHNDHGVDQRRPSVQEPAKAEVPARPAPLAQPQGVQGVPNPQGLHRPSAPDEAELREKLLKQQEEAARKQAELDRAANEQLQREAPPKAHFRGYHPKSKEPQWAYGGKTLKRSEIPDGVQVEPASVPPRPPVV